MLLTISQLRGLQRLAQVLLLLAVAELIITQPFGKTFPYPLAPTTAPEHSFQQYENYWQGIAGPTAISNMYQAVVANYGEINGYEPLINRVTIGIPPAVCAVNIDAGCDITSSNARVNYWSPNVIRLERTGPGAITLNVNPSSYWLVNGDRIFANDRVTEPNKKFIITNPSKYIEVKIAPL
jgi:hypothetical protein